MYKVMLDSGAWSAMTNEKPIAIEEYMKYVEENKRYVDYYVNLDVIGNPAQSYENYRIMKSNGFDPIPVFHADNLTKSRTYLFKYLSQTDYVAIGAIAKMITKRRLESLDLYFKALVDDQGLPIAKFHGFGVTSLKIAKDYPWFSLDSSSWVQYGRYGLILIPKLIDDKWNYQVDPYKVVVSDRKLSDPFHITKYTRNQKEQFSRYLEELGYDYAKVATNHLNRDKVNLVYYLGLQDQVLKVWPRKFKWNSETACFGEIRSAERIEPTDKGDNVLYIAGNFPILYDINKERELKNKYPDRFNRLISYFYEKSCETVIQLKKEDLNGNSQERHPEGA